MMIDDLYGYSVAARTLTTAHEEAAPHTNTLSEKESKSSLVFFYSRLKMTRHEKIFRNSLRAQQI